MTGVNGILRLQQLFMWCRIHSSEFLFCVAKIVVLEYKVTNNAVKVGVSIHRGSINCEFLLDHKYINSHKQVHIKCASLGVNQLYTYDHSRHSHKPQLTLAQHRLNESKKVGRPLCQCYCLKNFVVYSYVVSPGLKQKGLVVTTILLVSQSQAYAHVLTVYQ